MKTIKIEEDEVMVSFDVEALFPSIPVEKALAALDTHLSKQNITPDEKEVYMKAAKMCMEMNFFKFRDKFFKILWHQHAKSTVTAHFRSVYGQI